MSIAGGDVLMSCWWIGRLRCDIGSERCFLRYDVQLLLDDPSVLWIGAAGARAQSEEEIALEATLDAERYQVSGVGGLLSFQLCRI